MAGAAAECCEQIFSRVPASGAPRRRPLSQASYSGGSMTYDLADHAGMLGAAIFGAEQMIACRAWSA